ncbi:pseudaminic acid synthase [Prochlorococcus marinus str. MU1404]|uniref:pseudaminic acid synthase n=1 Tax=Prochlorococcus marinus TaxID=1219 RepID=UPI001ADAF611|nr:pseudaminic acid synthase [Prochlorococcus marinus]MBO8230542.1 pseudaminic acid synthase [Prochlorococcus marinus XMU1404]MBW3073588.1 pseudaminic acid synthase [Prochlorococcus marinus str. MU1404]MCR8545125.1 pseudaminic acid synthase [Prochlorococcus marinus CUG1432]
MKIGNFEIGLNNQPFVVAEMSGNHNQSLERAIEIVEFAAKTGVHGLKLQTYTADTITIDSQSEEFYIRDKDNLWKGRSLYDLYREAHTPWEWHKPIFKKARELGLIPFSTPFDFSSVDFLETLDVPCYKIASFENTDLSLIKKVASTGKPLIISTGMANISELQESISAARESGCKDLILLKCTSTYPSLPTNSNISTIPHMRDLFKCEVGISDHTLGVGVSIAAVAMGATFIEKHFTISRKDGGVDSDFSMEPNEMRRLVEDSKRAWQAKGEIMYGPTNSEKKSLKFRRSIYVVEDIKRGELFTSQNIRSIRPGLGLPIKYLEKIKGRQAKLDIKKGTPLSWEHF